MAKEKTKNKWFKVKVVIFIVIASLCAVSFIWQNQLEKWINYVYNPEISSDVLACELRMHFIDIGQGDSIAIELPDDKIMVIDAGPGKSEQTLVNYLNNAIFNARKDKVIDYFIATHQDEDHIGGADKIFDNFEIKNFYRPNVYTPSEVERDGLILPNNNICDTKVFNTMIEKMEAENCENVVVNSVYEDMPYLDADCGYDIEFLSPIDQTYSDANNYSPIIIFTYQNRKVMLTGDAETKVENQVLNAYSASDLKVDVLKLGHHGSSTSTSENFLNVVNPTYAVICVGEGNKYNHPTESVLERVTNKLGSHNVYRTDINSNIIFGIDADELSNGKGTIKISVNGQQQTYIYIEWWYVVVLVVGVSFVILILPKKSQKKLKKQLKKSKKSD